MADAALDKKDDALVQELHAQMVGKTKEEQAILVRDFSEKHLGVKLEDTPMVHLTDEQVRMIVSGATEDVKKAAEDAAREVERKYSLSPSGARDLVDEKAHDTLQKHRHRDQDLQECAKVLRALTRVASGRANFGELEAAYAGEAEYLKRTGREARAMSMGTDTTGGYLGGELFETMLYDNIVRHSLARKYATLITMTKEILRIPKLTTTVTAEQTSEAGTITSSQPVFDQFVLNTKKINVLTKPFSVELFETADPALVPTLIEFATRELAKKEDNIIFSTSAPGLLSQSTNNVILGGDGTSATSGATSIQDTTFDDMINLIYKLDPQYIPDEDISGSGMFVSEARLWVPQMLIQVLAQQKGQDNYHWTNVQELKHNKMIHGFDVKRVPTMSSAPDVTTRFAAFGDLKKVVCGVRPGFRVELMSQGSVDSVNLNETNSYAVRVTEFFDADCIDDSAFSLLKTATT
ncbi:MAG: phage major capsid protein [Pirellulales bacterium]